MRSRHHPTTALPQYICYYNIFMFPLSHFIQSLGYLTFFMLLTGWHEARVPTIATSVPRAAFTWITKNLKEHIKIPVVTSNRINTPELAEQVLARGDADMVSMARPLLADPEFVNKAVSAFNVRYHYQTFIFIIFHRLRVARTRSYHASPAIKRAWTTCSK